MAVAVAGHAVLLSTIEKGVARNGDETPKEKGLQFIAALTFRKYLISRRLARHRTLIGNNYCLMYWITIVIQPRENKNLVIFAIDTGRLEGYHDRFGF